MAKHGVDLDALTEEQRIALLEDLLDKTPEEPQGRLTDAQAKELRARVKAFDEGLLETVPFDEGLEMIRKRRVRD